MKENRRIPIETLRSRCLQGDRKAQWELFNRYRAGILRQVWWTLGTGTRVDVEETVHKVFIALFKSLKGFRGEASFDTWVSRICTRTCMAQLRIRYRKRERMTVNGVDDLIGSIGDRRFCPDEGLRNRELGEQIYRAVAALKPIRRVVFILFEIEGKSIQEIAEIMKTGTGTVKSRLFRARRDLAGTLRPYVRAGRISANTDIETRAV